nr:hypothetical protein [Pseudomonas sp. TH41]
MIRTQPNMLLGGGLLAASQAMAGDLLLWQTNNLSTASLPVKVHF